MNGAETAARSGLYLLFGCCWFKLVGLVSVSTGGRIAGLEDLVYLALVFRSFAVVMG